MQPSSQEQRQLERYASLRIEEKPRIESKTRIMEYKNPLKLGIFYRLYATT